jgi:uncharacterized protein YecE (DUF72 family)
LLGPLLLQLPPNLPADVDLLAATLAEFPREAVVAVEPRHPSWWTEAVEQTLRDHHAVLSWADRRGRPVTPLWRTSEVGYLRLHEGRAEPWPRYGPAALDSWLDRIASTFDTRTADVFVYFNNDQYGAAIADATAMVERARAHGLHVAARSVTPAR